MVMVEIPKGSRNKYEFDKERKVIKFDRILFSAVHYPCDYGFILDTLAEDGDPLDALVLVWEPTFPGCLIDVKPVGLFKIEDLNDVPPHLLKEIEHFFSIYKELEEKVTEVEGWGSKAEAIEIIKKARERYSMSVRGSGE